MDGKNILITGGSGSFGKAFIKFALENYKPKRLIVFSRDEYKQYKLQQQYDAPCMRYFIGDVRDKSRLMLAMKGVTWVIHAAALKHVPTGEKEPFEAVKTNVVGAENVIEAARENGVHKVMALSTDKAVNPVNHYGATKRCAETSFLAANNYPGTVYSICRYGNVAGSRGSVIPFFREKAAKKEPLPITSTKMTRFFIKIEDAVKFVADRLEHMHGKEIFVPKTAGMRILDLANAIGGNQVIVGIRPGEKLNETLISPEETYRVWNSGDFFTLTDPEHKGPYPLQLGQQLSPGFHYTSASTTRLTGKEIEVFINDL